MIDPMLPELWTIDQLWHETYDTFTFALKNKTKKIFSFIPGQFNMLYVFGVGEVPISISGDPDDSQMLVHTIRAVGSVTNRMATLRKGDEIGIRGPFGSHWPVEQAKKRDVVIMAGGIGLAPLRPVIYYILSRRQEYNNVTLCYGARSPKDLLFEQEAQKWLKHPDIQVKVSVDSASKEWQGNVGVVTTLLPRVDFDAKNAIAMLCGPEIMMRFAIADLIKHQVAPQNIYLSMERNMKCAIGFCGHCQWGPTFICKDGPVFCYANIKKWLDKRGI